MDINFNQEIILENDVVRLTPLNLDHFEFLLPFSIHEPTLWQYSLTPANGYENLKKYMQLAIDARKDLTSYPFIVFDKRVNQYAGSTRFYDYQKKHSTIQLGYTWYGKDFQRTGLNRNCKLLLLQYAFEKLEIERVEFRADSNNQRSILAMKSIGCIEEGILRSNCTAPIGRRSSIVLSILKNEWHKNVKTDLLNKMR